MIRRELPASPNLINASGKPMEHHGTFDLKFYFQGKLCHRAFVVSPSLHGNSIVRINLMKAYNPATNEVTSSSLKDVESVSVISGDTEGDSKDDRHYLIQVAHTTTVDPGTSQRVRCRLVHPVTRQPLLEARQFLAEVEHFTHYLMHSSDNGAFRPHMVNSDTICKTYERGQIIGEALPSQDVQFITDEEAVDSITATTKPPRAHTTDCLLYTSPSPRDS